MRMDALGIKDWVEALLGNWIIVSTDLENGV